MIHSDHVNLLRPAALPGGGMWADLGAGTGAFTLALRELLGNQAEIHAIDKDRSGLEELMRNYQARFGDSAGLHIVRADFGRTMPELPPLDGVLMANSLHFFKDKESILGRVRGLLKPSGVFLMVEYNVDRGNMWVPHPISFRSLQDLAPRAGFEPIRLLATHPSRFLREFYSAQTRRKG